MPYFTPQDRQQALDQLIQALQADQRIIGAILVGSGSKGFEDQFSDIDMAVVTQDNLDVELLFEEWCQQMKELFPIQASLPHQRDPQVFLLPALLENFLEIDISFQPLAKIHARRKHWKVVFDRSGKLDGIMQSTWDERESESLEDQYLRYLNSIWYYIIRVSVCVHRQQLWRAIYHLNTLRDRAVILTALLAGVEIKHYSEAHLLPVTFQKDLESTLPVSMQPSEIMRALREASNIFFQQAQLLDQQLGVKHSRGLSHAVKLALDQTPLGE